MNDNETKAGVSPVLSTDGLCHHTRTQGREGEKGSWCNNCGVKVYEVETRPCEGCTHYRNVIHGAVCKKHLMAASPVMLVTFKIADGTCWEEGHNLNSATRPEN